MKWVLKFIKEYNFKYWIANIMIVLGGGITDIFPVILLGEIIDKGIYQNDFLVSPICLFYQLAYLL